MKAITVGSATIDIIALIADDDVERMTMHNATSSFLLLEQGKKVDASSISTQRPRKRAGSFILVVG